jgi:hypothetical protein
MAEIVGDLGNGYVKDEPTENLTVAGLSKLQRWILDHAYQNRLAEHRDEKSKGADLYYGEVLAGFYGFAYEHPRNPEMDTRDVFYGHVFQPDVIGRSRYNAAQAAVSRAMTRLEQRGLVVVLRSVYSHWAGISLLVMSSSEAKLKA